MTSPKVFGGAIDWLSSIEYGYSSGTILARSALNWTYAGMSINQLVLLPLPHDYGESIEYPIPIGYFEDFWHISFWQHVRRYGSQATRMGPKIKGMRTFQNISRRPEYVNILPETQPLNPIFSTATPDM